MNPHRLTWEFTYNFPFAYLIGGVTIVAWALSRERKAIPRDPITILIICMAIWVSITTVAAILPADAFEDWDRNMKILFMTVLTAVMMGTRERLHALIWMIVISLGFFGAKGGLFTMLGGAKNLVLGPPNTFLADNNSLSLAFMMIVPLMRYLQLHSAIWYIRLGLIAAMLLTLLATIGTYSRGAMLGMAAMLLVLLIKSRKRGLILATGLVIALFALSFTPEYWIQRMESISDYQDDGSAQGRFDAWNFAYKLALDRPIFGGGFNVTRDDDLFFEYVPTAAKARSFHSIIFEMLGQHGWIGLSLYVILLVMGFGCAYRIERRARGRPDQLWLRDLAAMIQVSMVGFVVTGLFQDHAFFDLYYHLLAIVAVMYRLVRADPVPARPHRAEAYRPAFRTGEAVTEQGTSTDRYLGWDR